MDVIEVHTISGSKIHLRKAGERKTLCGREASNGATGTADCKLCLKAHAKLVDARDRLEYATRAAEMQDDVMGQAEPVESAETAQDAGVSVWAQLPSGDWTRYAYVPDGDADTVAGFVEIVEGNRHYADVITAPGRDALEIPTDEPVDAASDAMTETSTDDAPYGPWDASLTDRETQERALYHPDVFELSTGRTAADGYDFPVTVSLTNAGEFSLVEEFDA